MKYCVDYLLFEGALGLDITGPLEVFYTATKILERKQQFNKGYSSRFVGLGTPSVHLSSGLEICTDTELSTAQPTDFFIIPGGKEIRELLTDTNFVASVRKHALESKRIISVCEGAFLLAETGLADNHQVTTHWNSAEDLQKRYPRVKVVADAIYSKSKNLYTSAGVTAGIDLALAIVEEDFGMTIAMEVARNLVLYYRRPGNQTQFSSLLQTQFSAGSRFAALLNWLMEHLQESINVARMAEIATMSERNFARLFKQETNCTPNKYLELLRIDRARELISNGTDSLDQITVMCGFGTEETMRKAFLRRFGVTPSQFKLHF